MILAAVTWSLVLETRALRDASRISVRTHGVELSNNRNWQILENWGRIPPPRADWKGRDKNAMARRMLLVNEMNLAQWAFITSDIEALPPEDLRHWRDKTELAFKAAADSEDDEHQWLRGQIAFEIPHYPKAMQEWLRPLLERYFDKGDSVTS